MVLMASCSETDESKKDFENWRARNDAYFEELYQKATDSINAGKTNWKIIKPSGKDQTVPGLHTEYIVVEVLKSSSNTKSPEYTDSVRVHYRGNLMPSESYADGYQFDSSWVGEYNTSTMIPKNFAVFGMVDGFCTALQNMHIGDRWLVHIPYQLGYEARDMGNIPPYSTLNFDITLHSFCKPGMAMPVFQ